MPIKLNIDYVGMCLYVDDTKNTPPLFHVLLLAPDLDPAAVGPEAHGTGHAGCATDRHHPRIFYDTAYDDPDAQRLTGEHTSISLEDKILDLSHIPGTLDPNLKEVPNISEVAKSTVPRFRVELDPGPLVTARVTVAAGGGTPLDFKGPWEIEPPYLAENIAHKVRWTVQVPDEHLKEGRRLEWKLLGLNARGGQPLTPLYAMDGEINLRVMNVTRDELFPEDIPTGTAPQPGVRMSHFQPFYAVLERPASRPVPIWRGKPGNGGTIGGGYKCGTARAAVE
jgi:hypothetical protein